MRTDSPGMVVRLQPIIWIACVAIAGGCGPSVPPARERSATEENLEEIHRAYKLAEMKLQRPPRKLGEIETFFPDGNAQTYLTSPHDQKPYVIIWGTSTNLGPANYGAAPVPGATSSRAVSIPILAYEASGSEGKRHVVYITGTAAVLSEDEFKRATFPPGHKPK